MTKKFIILVGNVGTGKTTYCKEHFSEDFEIVRPDDWPLMSELERHVKFNKRMMQLTGEGKNIVLDGVNPIAKERKKILRFADERTYKKIAIDFGSGDEETLQRRIEASPQIPKDQWRDWHNINKSDYQKPNSKEGFDEIITI